MGICLINGDYCFNLLGSIAILKFIMLGNIIINSLIAV
nr:MAG TPA: hypothetical protein [Caudoviricetes sp.]